MENQWERSGRNADQVQSQLPRFSLRPDKTKFETSRRETQIKFTKAVLASWTQTSLQKRKSKAGPVVPGDSTTQEMCESCRAATKGK